MATSYRKPAPTITATATYSPTPAITSYTDFTFSDGATVHVNGGLVCSQHGRRHCRHHKEAHAAIIAKAASQEAAPATCQECGDVLRSDQHDYCDWCASIMPALRTNAGQPLSDEANFPMLMNVEQEVALVTAQMEADGFIWSDAAQTWVRARDAAMEAADAFSADYDDYLDSLDASTPLPLPKPLAVSAAQRGC